MKVMKYKKAFTPYTSMVNRMLAEIADEKIKAEAAKGPEQNAKVVHLTQPHQERKIVGPPTNRQVYDNIHKLPVPDLVKLYNDIREKRSPLSTIQRAIVITKIKEYLELGIVKLENPEPVTENQKELVNS